ncbi:MAG: metallophosphoesterase, partial [Vicinamibacteria bacterium]
MSAVSPRTVRPPKPEERRPMVGWFDPGPLVVTGFDVLISTLFGRHSDYRLLEALAAGSSEELYDYSQSEGVARDELWLDYIADTGDGWNSTYATAYWSSRPSLTVATSFGARHETRSGDIMLFGGDEVYPAASHADYHSRLVKPFETARNYSRAPEPDVFAIPGN